MTAYVPTAWTNNIPPPLSAANLNKLTDELEAQASEKSVTHSLPTWVDGTAPALSDAAPLNEMERVLQAVATSLGLSYTPTTWQAGWTPTRNATRFNRMEAQAQANRAAIDGGAITWTTSATPYVINSGGTYTGNWECTTSADTIQITTTSPVTIRGRIRNLNGGRCIYSSQAVNLTVDHCEITGPTTGGHRWLELANWRAVTITNCTIYRTRGIQLENPSASGATLLISRCRHENIRGYIFPPGPPGNFIQMRDVQNATSEISWCEIIDEYNLSEPTDIFSLYKTAYVYLHDTYIKGQYEPNNGSGSWSMNTVTLDPGGQGSLMHHNRIEDNHLLDTLSIGMFAGGSDNTFHRNRIVSSGKLPDGFTNVAQWSQPIHIFTGGTNNHAHNNVIGYTNQGSWRTGDFSGTVDDSSANQTYLSQPVTPATVDNETTIWNAKVAAAGVTIGA